MKKEYIAATICVVLLLMWWFRFDVYCETYPSCVAYDRLTSTWINPIEKANIQSKINHIKSSVKKDNIGTFRFEDALNAGITPEEIINHLNNKEKKGGSNE